MANRIFFLHPATVPKTEHVVGASTTLVNGMAVGNRPLAAASFNRDGQQNGGRGNWRRIKKKKVRPARGKKCEATKGGRVETGGCNRNE